ncbi:hypothetical protein ACQE3E_10980 [Methylomonas sp. MED-D]|uniref:hypothetical protein n=1 Tax=Methylomonas TaxID=416 RepID=UPI000A6F9530|nr:MULTISPECIES: hypothetical protein [Methylomonas]MDT4328491.1 hypothetical protein [Methylomonas sp. MV1]
MRPKLPVSAAIITAVLSACSPAAQTTFPLSDAGTNNSSANTSLLGKIQCRASLHPVFC